MSSQTSEYVGNNIVKIVNSRDVLNGTGFFIEINQNRYCITCHHCIYKLNEIFIERGDMKCSAEWVEEFSDMSKDIAILKINDDYCNNNMQAIKYAKEAMPLFNVLVWGFSFKDLETFPQGLPSEDSRLSSAPFLFHWKEENAKGSQKWNKKPEVKVYVFRFSGKYDVGFSGGPTLYTGNNNAVGIFTAKDNSSGYVVPIQTLLAKFEQEGILTESSHMVNMSHYIEKGNEFFITRDYHKAIENYQIVLNDQNYVAALNNKGLSLRNLKNDEEAIEYFDKVLAIDPNNINALNNKGLSLGNLKNFEEAIECYDKVLAIDSKHFDALANRALTIDRLGRFEEAIECYD